MSHMTLSSPDLFSQTQVASLLGVDRRVVRELALAHELDYKLDPTRAGKMLDRSDVNCLARSLRKKIDWDRISV